jgi:hypothetical protein
MIIGSSMVGFGGCGRISAMDLRMLREDADRGL